MTDQTEHLAPNSRELIDIRAASFIERRDSEGWTEANEEELETWLNAASAHRVAFIRLQASWRRTERLVALRSEQVTRIVSTPAGQKRYFKGAAAFVATLALLGIAATYWMTPRYDTYATTVGGHETLTLHDGSLIELNTDTIVRVLRDTNHRLVRLDKGEAFFQIRHDVKHPFVVIASDRRLIDLGTKFSVRSDEEHLRVTLVEGRVRVESEDGSARGTHTLSPGDVLVASRGNVSVTTQPIATIANELAWRRGLLMFHETTLLDAAHEFNRYNEIKIVIRDRKALHETINGALPANDLEEFSRMARNIFGLKTERRGNKILFSR